MASRADVSFLASDLLEGRGTPSRGLDLAAEYIASQFRRAGLEPVGDDGYFQTANFATVAANTEGLELSLDAGGTAVKAAAASVTLQDPAATDLKSRAGGQGIDGRSGRDCRAHRRSGCRQSAGDRSGSAAGRRRARPRRRWIRLARAD